MCIEESVGVHSELLAFKECVAQRLDVQGTGVPQGAGEEVQAGFAVDQG